MSSTMDDAIRQAIEALESAEATLRVVAMAPDTSLNSETFRRQADYVNAALTALKAMQPRPDVVVAAREAAKQLRIYAAFEADRMSAMLIEDARKLEAAVATEQEWEVRWTWGSGAETFATESLARKDLGIAWPCGDHPDDVRRAFVEKAKPKQVSREQAIEDAARDLEMEAALSSSVPSATVSKAITAFRAALSRVRETG